MAGSVNKVILIGNLGADPELRRTPNGVAVTNFSLATSRKFKAQDGQFREDTEWHNIVAWNKAAEIMAQYLKKGSKVYVEGFLQTRSWETDGVRKYRTEIVAREFHFLDSKPAGGGSNQQNYSQPSSNNYGPPSGNNSNYQDMGTPPSEPSNMPVDDDLPF
jgi:single-strand DNA-binding protein